MECEDNLHQMEDEDNLETLAEQSLSVVICPRNSSVSYASQNIKMEFVEAVDTPVNTKQVRASCPKTTGVLSINSLSLSHNDHPIIDETNRFAVKYHTFTDNMLNDIKFWTETGNITMRTQYQMLIKRYSNAFFLPQDISNAIQTFKRQNHVECEAAVLLNYLLERKAEDTRWVVNWKVDPTNNSL
ncbi:4835_t:CDS:2, partial [Gigaspora rosea]